MFAQLCVHESLSPNIEKRNRRDAQHVVREKDDIYTGSHSRGELMKAYMSNSWLLL